MSQNQLFALIGSLLVLGAVLAMYLRGSRAVQGWQTIVGGVAVAVVLVLIAVVLDKA